MVGVFRIREGMWVRIEPLIPVRVNTHPMGGGRRRVPDSQFVNVIFYVLRTGCRCRALDGTGIFNGAAAYRRFQERCGEGGFDALWAQALRDCDNDVGIDWAWLSVEG